MKKMVVLLLSLLVATSAFAVIDGDPDMLGLYFDVNADNACAEGITPYATVTMFAILTNPSMDFIGGYEFGYDIDGSALVLGTIHEGQALDVGTAGNHIVGLGAPMETSEATLLSSIDVLYTDATMAPVYFTLTGTQPSSIDPLLPTLLYNGGDLMTLGTSTLPGTYSATINGVCEDVVATENTSFDALKSLYR